MRVLHVGTGNLFGGVESLLLTLAQTRGQAPKLEQEFGCFFSGRLKQGLEATGARVYDFGPTRWCKPWSVVRARRAFRELQRVRRFDVVIYHSAWALLTLEPIQAKRVLWVHEHFGRPSWVNLSLKWTRPEFMICNSAYTEKRAKEWLPGVPAQVLYYPLILAGRVQGPIGARRKSLRAEFGVEQSEVCLIQVSRLEPWKGHELLLRACSQVQSTTPWKLWIVGGAQKAGEQHYLDGLKSLVQELGLDARVRFLGERSDVIELMAAADIFVQPNLGPEPFGIVFIEAMAAGLPCIGVAEGGVLETVTPEVGILIGEKSPTPLALAIQSLLGSAELRAQMRLAAPAHAESLTSPPSQLAKLSQLLQGRSG